MRNSFARFLALAIVLFVSFELKAQDIASMTGVVTDPSGAVIPQVNVKLVNSTTHVNYEAVTNTQGAYRFPNVSPGPGYSATYAISGFKTYTVNDLYLAVATTRTQNVILQIGETTDQVDVSGGAENVTINTTDATIGNNFDVKMLNDLPVQVRNSPQVLFNLQPGVAVGSVTGARTDQNTTTLDGLDVNDIAAGQGVSNDSSTFQIISGAPLDAVQEFRGTVAGQLANSGPGGGGQFQLVTKSGTNQFHGNVNEYHRDTSTVANSWFNNNANPKVARPPLVRNQFGGNIGGPIFKDKLFFFFNYYGSRISQSVPVSRTVPLDSFRNGNVSYIKATGNGVACAATSRQNTTPQCIGTLTSAQVKALDPAGIGFSPNVLATITSRYPNANDLTGGDGINTGLFRFNDPQPNNVNNYLGRIDYNLTDRQRIFGRFTINRQDSTQSARQFPSDPVTHPFQDRSYSYVVGHTWMIGSNKVNQFEYGDTITKFNFPTTYAPTGTANYTFGAGTTVLLSSPFSGLSSQKRRIPIPEFIDNFNWTIGSHSLVMGGTFKFIKTNSQLVNDFNAVSVGLGGNVLGLNATLRPSDIRTAGTTGLTTYDNAFSLALGRVGAVDSNYNYNNKGAVLTQGGGTVRQYRYYQTEIYIADTWKVNPSLTLTYGLRYQLYTVPYEANGAESVQNTSFDDYFAARQKQSAAGISGDNAVPFITYKLGGKANSGPDLYSQNNADFAPRFAFAYNPDWDRKTTFNGGVGMIYDRTVINAVNFIQDQSSYLFQNSASNRYGSANATTSLRTDPRLGSSLSFPAPPTAPAITSPYTPYVDAGTPFGLANNQFNTIVDPHLKDPYSIVYNFGFQHEFPGNMVMKLNYAGRQGRRLLAQADASQLVDFVDKPSGQSLGNAFGTMTVQSRATGTVTPQPWFENQVGKGGTAFLYRNFASLIDNGDFADFVQALGANELIDTNVGMASQFAENTFVTNKGSSTYNGMLLTVSKNLSRGLQFDYNYTWSHSIDNVSAPANFIASSQGSGFICDAQNLRACRANSDFDIKHVMNATVIYDLPFGRGRSYGAAMPRLLDALVGGWQISGIPQWRSGVAFSTHTSAFVAGYANDSPAIFNGDNGAIRSSPHKTSTGQVTLFADPARAKSAFVGPIGFQIGSRNNLRGPSGFFFDAGLGKTFSITPERVKLQLRLDTFNLLNHPVFSTPSAAATGVDDITSGSFGQILSTASSARVAQISGRLQF